MNATPPPPQEKLVMHKFKSTICLYAKYKLGFSVYFYSKFVTQEHKTSLKCQFFDIWDLYVIWKLNK